MPGGGRRRDVLQVAEHAARAEDREALGESARLRSSSRWWIAKPETTASKPERPAGRGRRGRARAPRRGGRPRSARGRRPASAATVQPGQAGAWAADAQERREPAVAAPQVQDAPRARRDHLVQRAVPLRPVGHPVHPGEVREDVVAVRPVLGARAHGPASVSTGPGGRTAALLLLGLAAQLRRSRRPRRRGTGSRPRRRRSPRSPAAPPRRRAPRRRGTP